MGDFFFYRQQQCFEHLPAQSALSTSSVRPLSGNSSFGHCYESQLSSRFGSIRTTDEPDDEFDPFSSFHQYPDATDFAQSAPPQTQYVLVLRVCFARFALLIAVRSKAPFACRVLQNRSLQIKLRSVGFCNPFPFIVWFDVLRPSTDPKHTSAFQSLLSESIVLVYLRFRLGLPLVLFCRLLPIHTLRRRQS